MYWVYDNRVHRYAKVHRAECTFCDHGRGLHRKGSTPVAGEWLGPFTTTAEALRVAASTGREVGTCSVCCP